RKATNKAADKKEKTRQTGLPGPCLRVFFSWRIQKFSPDDVFRFGHRGHISAATHSLEAGGSFPTHKKKSREKSRLLFLFR
ncbi:MAG: hypothetical protein FWF77_07060, partial [Defluviitaleaceae bacterium]|nr:hypothetical protein [Defluviitaleaceae bacterium]